MSKKTEQAALEAVARAMLSYCELDESTVYHLRICAGPAPCYPDQSCSCTRNLYGLARAAIAASKAHAKSLKGKR